MLERLLTKKYIFFGGKGGVGKTTVSAAFSVLFSERYGKNILLVSTDPAHSLSDIFEMEIGSGIKSINGKNLYAMEIDPEEESKKYIKGIIKKFKKAFSPVILDELKRQIEVAYNSPGAEEAAVFDKFVEIVEDYSKEFDMIIFDTAPTGHTLRLLSLPELLGAWIEELVKKRKKIVDAISMLDEKDSQSEQDPILEVLRKRKHKLEVARDILINHDFTSFIFVLTAEKLPVYETQKAKRILESYNIPVDGVVINRLFPKEAGAFFGEKIRLQNIYVQKIKEMFSNKFVLEVPFLPYEVVGFSRLRRLVGLIEKEG